MAGRTTVQYGSQGDDVKTLQEYLNKNGANLVVDGNFGSLTQSAVKDYQKKNGLSVDGIVGDQTWGALLGNNASGNSGYTPTAAPTISPTPTAPKYDTSTWDESTKGSAAGSAYEAAKDAINNYGDFAFSENEWLESIKDDIKNYGEFSYDVNSDALYQQYKDQYVRQGKLASADVMGQAAAMTGGYGNSYAATVGNQAYQSYLQQLNDRVPELYQAALDRYNMGKEDLYNKYGLLMKEYEREYGLYSDEYNKLLDALGIAKDDYYSGAEMFYTEQDNKNGVLGQEFNDAMAIWNADNTNAWKQAEWEEGLKQYANDEAWRQKEYDLNDRQVTLQEKAYADSKATAADNAKKYSGTAPNGGGSYNNGSLTTGQVKALQSALGVTADGYYGSVSQKAAGGLSAAEAYAKYVGGGDTGGSGITDDMEKKAADFNSNADLNSYVSGLVNSGAISDQDGDKLFAKYADQNERFTVDAEGKEIISKDTYSYKDMVKSTSGWSVANSGGGNLWGIDSNASVIAPNGETITLNQLRNTLKSEGMTPSQATNAIKKLQQNLGISSNWMFGW